MANTIKAYKNLSFAGFTVISTVCFFFLLSTGCRTRREIVLEKSDLSNMAFERDQMPESLRLEPGEGGSFVLWNRTSNQSHHILQLEPTSALKKRFHRRHDITLFGVSGHAIIEVERYRHYLTPGTAVFIPRMHNYSVVPHESPGNVTIVMVYSPPFDGSDTLLLEER